MMTVSPRQAGKELRKRSNYTIKKIAKKVNASESSIKRLFSREAWPKHSTIAKRVADLARKEMVHHYYRKSKLVPLHIKFDEMDGDENRIAYSEYIEHWSLVLGNARYDNDMATNAHAALLYARILFDLRRFDEAEDAFTRAVKLLNAARLDLAAAKAIFDCFGARFNHQPIESRRHDPAIKEKLIELKFAHLIERMALKEPWNWRVMRSALQITLLANENDEVGAKKFKKLLIKANPCFESVHYIPAVGVLSIADDPDFPRWIKEKW